MDKCTKSPEHVCEICDDKGDFLSDEFFWLPRGIYLCEKHYDEEKRISDFFEYQHPQSEDSEVELARNLLELRDKYEARGERIKQLEDELAEYKNEELEAKLGAINMQIAYHAMANNNEQVKKWLKRKEALQQGEE